ncbi:HupE/UreJ family protein [Methylomarinum vadi]|uniref:HupE/UreJ family protein n=1 Tax=Methylomarinum vadi TaxID=438855 RepID=UPI0004DF6E3F|nr:HupE/UreJ family protein [Methylomarinum vadi]
MRKVIISRYFSILVLSVISTSALAHTGIASIHGFTDGLVHPWLGMDHLLVMVVIGLWAAKSGGRTFWLLPGAFLSAMVAGAWLSFAGIAVSGAETWVAFSVLALGLLLTLNKRLPTVLATGLVAAFALGHGYVHAAEIGAEADAMTYALGFLTATAVLHALGMVSVFTGPLVGKTIRAVFTVMCTLVGTALLIGV